jgi:hypothetical protein
MVILGSSPTTFFRKFLKSGKNPAELTKGTHVPNSAKLSYITSVRDKEGSKIDYTYGAAEGQQIIVSG